MGGDTFATKTLYGCYVSNLKEARDYVKMNKNLLEKSNCVLIYGTSEINSYWNLNNFLEITVENWRHETFAIIGIDVTGGSINDVIKASEQMTELHTDIEKFGESQRLHTMVELMDEEFVTEFVSDDEQMCERHFSLCNFFT